MSKASRDIVNLTEIKNIPMNFSICLPGRLLDPNYLRTGKTEMNGSIFLDIFAILTQSKLNQCIITEAS